ncbi:MAG: tryptophan transporter [Bacillota bacterium]
MKESYLRTGPGPTAARSREVAVVAMLLAIGAVLRAITPNVAGITPNFVIAMYCLAILLIRPGFAGALGIGVVGGAVCMLFSKSPIPYLNLISEPAGALACAFLARYLPALAVKNYALKPAVATVISTLVSGVLYITLNTVALKAPFAMWLTLLFTVVIPVSATNAVLAQVLYLPAKRVLRF